MMMMMIMMMNSLASICFQHWRDIYLLLPPLPPPFFTLAFSPFHSLFPNRFATIRVWERSSSPSVGSHFSAL